MADKIDEALKAIKALEGRMSALETAVKNKKDMKPEHETAIKVAVKQAAEAAAMMKEAATKAVIDTRFKAVEVQVHQAMTLAAAAMKAAEGKK